MKNVLADRLREALPQARAVADRGDLWTRLGAAVGAPAEEALRQCAAMVGLPAIAAEDLATLPVVADSQVKGASAAVVVLFEDRPCVVVADPWDEGLRAAARRQLGSNVRFAIASFDAVVQCRARLAQPLPGPARAEAANGAGQTPSSAAAEGHVIDATRLAAERNPVLRFVDRTILDAWSNGASDVHVETLRDGLHTRYRIDGALVPGPNLAGAEAARQAVSRLKVLAELDIAEQRVPQDGRVRFVLEGRAVDFRVSVMPSAHGEDVVLRILDKRQIAQLQERLSLAALGFDAGKREVLHELAERAHGMLLVTGPTGSGKTTTLYSLLTELASTAEKTVTIEDPIEYEIEGVLQIPVNDKKGLTFARGLRSILRHDPDRIMVGEIRDQETADIAVQAALTGHQVFATVHANNVFDVIGRFVHMHVDLYSLMSSLNGVVSQRLVRRLCPHCRSAAALTEIELRRLRAAALPAPAAVFAPVGCEACRQTGYRGRTAIVEMVSLDDPFRDLVVRRAPLAESKDYLSKRGTQTLAQSGLPLLSDGVTSFSEYWRAVATG